MIQFFRKHIRLHDCGRPTEAIVARILDLIATAKLKPVIFKSCPLAEAAEAHCVMESRNFFGRLVMNPREAA